MKQRFCAFPQADYYEQIKRSLKPGGTFGFDVFLAARFGSLAEAQGFERQLIATPEESYEVCNWLQHFDENTIHAELDAARFDAIETHDLATGGSIDSDADAFMVLART